MSGRIRRTKEEMQKELEELRAANASVLVGFSARIPAGLKAEFTEEARARGMSQQEAVSEAMSAWLANSLD